MEMAGESGMLNPFTCWGPDMDPCIVMSWDAQSRLLTITAMIHVLKRLAWLVEPSGKHKYSLQDLLKNWLGFVRYHGKVMGTCLSRSSRLLVVTISEPSGFCTAGIKRHWRTTGTFRNITVSKPMVSRCHKNPAPHAYLSRGLRWLKVVSDDNKWQHFPASHNLTYSHWKSLEIQPYHLARQIQPFYGV